VSPSQLARCWCRAATAHGRRNNQSTVGTYARRNPVAPDRMVASHSTAMHRLSREVISKDGASNAPFNHPSPTSSAPRRKARGQRLLYDSESVSSKLAPARNPCSCTDCRGTAHAISEESAPTDLDTTRGAEPTEVLRYWPSVARIADGVRSSGQGDSGYSPRLAPDSRVNSASHATHCASAAAECPTKTFIRWLRPCVPSSTRSTACSFT